MLRGQYNTQLMLESVFSDVFYKLWNALRFTTENIIQPITDCFDIDLVYPVFVCMQPSPLGLIALTVVFLVGLIALLIIFSTITVIISLKGRILKMILVTSIKFHKENPEFSVRKNVRNHNRLCQTRIIDFTFVQGNCVTKWRLIDMHLSLKNQYSSTILTTAGNYLLTQLIRTKV